jgi:hypothetical protein
MPINEKLELNEEKRRVGELIRRSMDASAQIASDNSESAIRRQRAIDAWNAIGISDERQQSEYERLSNNALSIQREVRALIWIDREEAEGLVKRISETADSDIGGLLMLYRQLGELETREVEVYKPRLRDASNRFRNSVMEIESFVYSL